MFLKFGVFCNNFSIFWALLWDFSFMHKDIDIEMQNLTEKFIAYLGPGIFSFKIPEIEINGA